MSRRADEITPEVPRTSTGRRVALFVIGIVLVFMALNFGARGYLQNNGTNLGYRIVHAKWGLLDSMTEPVDWLVFGDSSGCHGIVPEVLAEELGGSAVNLATLANLLVVDDAWMLARYIERFGPPKNVVLVHAHDVWHRGYRSALVGQIPRPWGFWKEVPPTIDFTPAQERKLFLSRFVPLYAENTTLRAHLRNLGPPQELAFSMTDSGFVPARPHSPSRLARDINRTRKFLRENDRFRVSRLNTAAIDVIGRLSQKHRFPVYLVNGPMHEGIAARADFRAFQEQKSARLERMTDKYADFRVLHDLQTYATQEMEVCVDHVIPEMAPDFTRKVARSIVAEIEENPLRTLLMAPGKAH